MNVPTGSPQSFRSARALHPKAGHARQSSSSSHSSLASQHSVQSAPPVPTVPTQAQPIPMRGAYPVFHHPGEALSPGSKMAEDMAAAVALAQASMRSPHRSPPHSPTGSTGSAVSSIGEMMLGQSPLRPTQPLPENPFEYDAVLGDEAIDELMEAYFDLPLGEQTLGTVPPRRRSSTQPNTPRPTTSPRSAWPAAPAYPPSGYPGPRDIQSIGDVLTQFPLPGELSPNLRTLQLPRHPGLQLSPMLGGGNAQLPAADPHTGPALRSRTNPFADVSQAANAVALTWRGPRSQTFALITTPGTPSYTQDARYFPVDVASSTTQVVEVPPSWAGRVQKMTGREDDPATWCELVFDGFRGMTFFNVSYLHGNNGPVLMYPWQDSPRSGSALRAAQVAPQGATVRDHGGTEVVCGTVEGPSPRRALVRRFYHEFDFTPAHGAVVPADTDQATRATHERHIVCDFL